MRRVRWGIISTAKIGIQQVIPAIQQSLGCEVVAIASRSLDRAREAALKLGIPRAYGSYQALLDDPEVEAVYNPLPNHLHVPVSIQALEAGKHVLCEKPIALSALEGQQLVEAGRRFPSLKLMEGFMYRHHPQWFQILEVLRAGDIGELREVNSRFSYFNDNPENIRNQADLGGGGLLDIGCYPISLARLVFGDEPRSALATIDYDPGFQTDRYAAALLRFDRGVASFSCGTQMAPHQSALLVGSKGWIAVETPFTPPPDKPARWWLDRGQGPEQMLSPVCNRYTAQADLFVQAVLTGGPVPTPIEDAVSNMLAIEAVRQSGEVRGWAEVEKSA